MSDTQTNKAVALRQNYLSLVNNEKLAKQMESSLLDADPGAVRRIAAYMANAAMKQPSLYNCDKNSIMKVMLDACSLGIEPNGRDAHVIPYGTTATLIVDYKGLITLATKSERISSIDAEVVCENDSFEWHNGEINHGINWKKPRGEACAVYAIARFKDGTTKSAVMTMEEVEGIRRRSRAGKSGPWVTDFNEMAKKTAVRRLSKYLPLSPSAAAVVAYDQEQEFAPIQNDVAVAREKQSPDALADALVAEAEATVVEAELASGESTSEQVA